MDFTIMPDTEREMFAHLRSSNCCLTCCLRLIGTRAPEAFRNYLSSVKSFNYTSENDTDDTVPCICCLGVLQPDIQERTSEQIIDAVRSNGCDSSTFTCALSIPIFLRLRERFLQISLGRQFKLSENQLCNLKLRTQNIKEVWKIQVLPKVEAAIGKQLMSGTIPSPFLIDVTYNHADDEDDCKKFCKKYNTNLKLNGKKLQNNIYSRNHIEKLQSQLGDEEFMEYFDLQPSERSTHVTIDKISCFHAGIFIGGRYNKLSRHLSQTPWFINGEKKKETSVQDLLCNRIQKYTGADSLKFLSSGREDVDVRTINLGRPFAVELVNPKVTKIPVEKFSEMVDEVNTSTNLVKITSTMRLLCPIDLKKLKEGENVKTKFYRALCILRFKSRDSVDLEQFRGMKNLKIVQKTPIRVLHRRPLTPRVRVLHEMRARWLTNAEIEKIRELYDGSTLENDFINQLFIFDVKTQAGTYVKEFVHGDFGRTRPNLCDILGAEVDIVALDVTAINIDWP